MKIAVVVPTIREDKFKVFFKAWRDLFHKHRISLYVVKDGKEVFLDEYHFYDDYDKYNSGFNYYTNREIEEIREEEDENKKKDKQKSREKNQDIKRIMGEYSDLIYNLNDGVRNLGFAKAYKDGADIIISLDDDTLPEGDTIQDHIDILNTKQPISFMNSVDDVYMRGFPYWIREEAPVMFSHGVWNGVYDFDASTQLLMGTPQPRHRKMPVPKGVLMPVCVMNVAFRREVLPYYYQAPMFGDINRFADIWSGWEVKKAIDKNNWAMVTGYAKVNHNRASNPFVNLIKEAKGISLNEEYGKDEYFKLYQNNIKRWQEFLKKYE